VAATYSLGTSSYQTLATIKSHFECYFPGKLVLRYLSFLAAVAGIIIILLQCDNMVFFYNISRLLSPRNRELLAKLHVPSIIVILKCMHQSE